MEKQITVKVSLLLEARALAMLVQKANEFSSSIFITMDEKTVSAKSIMGIMGIGMDTGKQIMITAEGSDEEKAVAAIEEFLTL